MHEQHNASQTAWSSVYQSVILLHASTVYTAMQGVHKVHYHPFINYSHEFRGNHFSKLHTKPQKQQQWCIYYYHMSAGSYN